MTAPTMVNYPGAVPEETSVPRPMTHAEIADDLEARIRAGEYPPGTFIPSYSQVAQLYSVSESTADKVVGKLRDRKLIERWPGRGNAVVHPLPPPETTQTE